MAVANSQTAVHAATSPSVAKPINGDGAYTDIDHLLRLRFAAQDLTLSYAKPSAASLSGSSRTRFRGRGMEFEEVRIYQAGDDIRSIDWRVTARTQVPHTKLFREERERPTFIVADQRANLFFGSQRCFKSVLCANVAATLAWTALAHSDRVGGIIFGNKHLKDIRARRSKHAVLELIHELHEFNRALSSPLVREREISLLDMLQDTRRLAKPGSAVFIVSDFQDFTNACEEQLFLLARHTDVTLLHMYDRLETALPGNSNLTVSDGNSRTQLDAADSVVRQNFSRRYQEHVEQLRRCCQKLKIGLHSFATHEDEMLQLRNLYSKRSKSKRTSNR